MPYLREQLLALSDDEHRCRYKILHIDADWTNYVAEMHLLPITEGSAKIRSGPPTDEPDDYDLPIWAGVLPASVTLGAPIADPRNKDGADTPDHAKGVARIAGQA